MTKTKWSFYNIWNESLENREERELKPRHNIWASELGGSLVDRYLKMAGVQPSNPPNPRSLRKFEAGNIWEWIVGLVLKRAGILLDEQEWVSFQYAGLPEVTGKIDFVAGGKPDWDKALMDIKDFGFPDFITRVASDLVNELAQKYPLGMDKIVLEIKSCSSFMFEKYETTGLPADHHALQIFHYLKAKNLPEGHIVYVSKDDCRLLEIGVFNPSPLEELYRKDIETLFRYLKAKEQPPLEPAIDFNREQCKFYPNWRVMYSQYLTKLYGYKDQLEFETKYRPITAKWNRVAKRVIDGAKMTKLNLEVIEEIKKDYADFEQVVKGVKK